MKLATMLSVAVVGATLTHPVTQATDWLNTGQPPVIASPTDISSSFAPIYIGNVGNIAQTDLDPVFENVSIPINRLALVQNEISSYSSLQDDWDGNGGTPPDTRHVRDAITFLDRLPSGIAIPTPMIGSSGDIGLYWDLPSFYADVAFEGNGALSLFVKNKQTREEKFAAVDDLHSLSQDWFVQMLGRGQNA